MTRTPVPEAIPVRATATVVTRTPVPEAIPVRAAANVRVAVVVSRGRRRQGAVGRRPISMMPSTRGAHPRLPARRSADQVGVDGRPVIAIPPGAESTVPVTAGPVAGPPPEAALVPVPAGPIEDPVHDVHGAPDQGGFQHHAARIPTVDDRGLIPGNDHDVGADRADRYVAVLVGDHLDRVVADQVSLGGGALAQPLHRVVHRTGLFQEGLPQICRPPHVTRHHGQHIGNQDQGLDARVPSAVRHRVGHLGQGKPGIRAGPLMSGQHLGGVGGGQQHIAQERIRVEGDGGQDPVQPVFAQEFGADAPGCQADQHQGQRHHEVAQ